MTVSFLFNFIMINGNEDLPMLILYDYHYDHDFDYDYHYVRKRHIENIPELLDTNGDFIVENEALRESEIKGTRRYISCVDSENRFWCSSTSKNYKSEDKVVNNELIVAREVFKMQNSKKREISDDHDAPREARAALYDPTYDRIDIRYHQLEYWPTGFHHVRKIPRTFEISEYLHHCYLGDPTIVCIVLREEDSKPAIPAYNLDYKNTNKLRFYDLKI